MLFNSLDFVFFFPIAVFIYFAIPHRFRWAFLLAASYYFYMCWKPEYVILIVVSTAVDYFAGIMMFRSANRPMRRIYLTFSLTTNLGILFLFKYFNFFNDSVREALSAFNIFYGVREFQLLLPIGISFYTFQTLSYTIDVYRGERKPETHPGIFALYVSFFPQLVAGPIERSTRLLPQLYRKNNFDAERVISGLKLMLVGFFKKIVIADRLAEYVDVIYADAGSHHGEAYLLATYFFAFQIYCDFSGYSDIAIGGARVMGYDLMKNFERPYFARSIREFWHRWHISLSTWFRDYLYIPLGGSRRGRARKHLNVIIVFLLSGLWHGANWTFAAWGLLHGLYYSAGRTAARLKKKITGRPEGSRRSPVHDLSARLFTFHLVLFGWIFFRARNIGDALLIIKNIFTDTLFTFDRLASAVLPLTLDNTAAGSFLTAILLIAALATAEGIKEFTGFDYSSGFRNRIADFSFWVLLTLVILLLGKFGARTFIYFLC